MKKSYSFKKITGTFFISVSLMFICFLTSYYITNYYTNPSKNFSEKDLDRKEVFNNSSTNLEDNMYITLKTEDTIDMSESFVKLKDKLNLKGNFTLESLSKELEKSGYTLNEFDDTKLVYNRNKSDDISNFQSNKYYLGEEKGFISVFKTDSSGKVLESEKKVYEEYKAINNLPEIDQSLIKENKFFYDTLEEALYKLSEMVS
ncbi:hypothetical protein [Clostridium sp.]|uniref:hypothetical protein n=1 Tax=Clostridium sp. TaxID=1506 RepID=UPI00262CDA38|nr:hypothetical protein [Clostridium sp.]